MRVTTTPPIPPPRKAPPLAGIALLAYLVALAYASLYPMRDWRSFGWSALHFLTEPWPRYWTGFDVFTNVLAYMPAGVLLFVAWYRRTGVLAALALATLAGSALSLALESLQSLLPGRVPSRLDWLTNTLGALLGALLASLLRPRREHGTGHAWHRPALLRPHAMAVIGLLGGWLIAQVYPQRVLFGTGDVLDPAVQWLSAQAALVSVARGDAPVTAQVASVVLPWLTAARLDDAWAVLLEASVAASTIVAIGLLVADTLLPDAPKALITGFAIGCALMIKHAATGWLVGTSPALGWLTSGAQAGLVIGVVVLSLLGADASRARLWLALGALALATLTCNLLPVNAYHALTLQQWDQGAWRNFNGLMRVFALGWPYAAMVVVLLRLFPRSAPVPAPAA